MTKDHWLGKSLGKNIRRLRMEAGLSQADLSEALAQKGVPDIHPQTITKLEAGTRTLRFTEGVALAEILGVTPGDLLELDEDSALAARWINEADALVEQIRKSSEESKQLLANLAATYKRVDGLISSPPPLENLDRELVDGIRQTIEALGKRSAAWRASDGEHSEAS